MIKSNLHEMFDFEEDENVIDNNKPILLIDGHNLAYRTVFSSINQVPTDNEQFYFWKHLMISSLFSLVKRFDPCKIILTFDGYKDKSWRKQIYPEYKSQRKAIRDKSIIDFNKFYPVFNELIEEIKTVFTTIYTMKIDGCEGDDIIAVLSKEVFKDKKIIIISSDGDMNQLLSNKNINQFNPIKNKMVENINIKQNLLLKVISGDTSDNIKAIKPKCGIKTAQKIINEGLDEYIKDKQTKENYERNLKLIDFNYIPKEISRLIINCYNEYKINNIDTNILLRFFTKNKMTKNIQDWQQYGNYIKALK